MKQELHLSKDKVKEQQTVEKGKESANLAKPTDSFFTYS